MENKNSITLPVVVCGATKLCTFKATEWSQDSFRSVECYLVRYRTGKKSHRRSVSATREQIQAGAALVVEARQASSLGNINSMETPIGWE